MSIRIEQYDGGDVLYVALDPDGAWAQSEFPSELVTLDYNAQGGLIGIEMAGSAARNAADSVFESLLGEDLDKELREKLIALTG
jgi:uncharacterized protein YuzE